MKIEINIDESAVDRLMSFLESRFPAVERAKTKAEKRDEETKIRVEGRYKKIGFEIDEEKHFALKMLALKKKMTLTEMVMIVLDELLERDKPEVDSNE